MFKQLQDAELAALAATTGDARAFGELARRHSTRVRALLRRMGAQGALADDIAQEAFIVAFRRIASYRNEGAFNSWVARIAARLYVRRWKRESRFESSAGVHAEIAQLSTPDDVIDLDRALQSLSEPERLCVSLCHGAGWSHTEIASQLGMPVGTVKSHVKRGLDKLKMRMGATTQANSNE